MKLGNEAVTHLKNLCRISKRRISLALFFAWVVSSCGLAASQKNFDLFFPLVANGQFGAITLETALLLSNPGLQSAQVTLEPINGNFDGPQSFSLAPAKTNVVFMRGVQTGAVRLTSNAPLTASSYMLVRSVSNPLKIISDITAPAQPLTSKASVPVFVGTTLADNTGIALVYHQNGCYRFTLYDAEGRQVGSRIEPFGFNSSRPASQNAAMFVTELFPDIAPGFIGSLIVEHGKPADIAQGFAISAVYASDLRLSAASVTPLDTPARYIVILKSGAAPGEQAQELAVQYGFTISSSNPSARTIVTVMTQEIARAVARDPRVDDVLVDDAAAVNDTQLLCN